MTANDRDFRDVADTTAKRIRSLVPGDLAEMFRQETKITPGEFHPCPFVPPGEVCAVDGSNGLLLESGSMAIALFRAAQSTYHNRERHRRSLSPLRFGVIGPSQENEDFYELYEECFGELPGTPLGNEDRSRVAGVLRDTLEYWITEQMAHSLSPGALLLRDGPLRVSHASHDPVLSRIEDTCNARGISLVGVSKRTSATWGGGYPLVPTLAGLAEAFGISPPWWIRIDPNILDHAQYPQWQHGQMYVTCLHPHSKSPLKLELTAGIPEQRVREIMGRLGACSMDGRIPGYPYPLLDAHRTVVLSEEIMEQARSDLIRRIVAAGMKLRTYEILFGDYHDEFARY